MKWLCVHRQTILSGGVSSYRMGVRKKRQKMAIAGVFAQAKISPWLLIPGVVMLVASALLTLAPLVLVFGLVSQVYDVQTQLLVGYARATVMAVVAAAGLTYMGTAWCGWVGQKVVAAMRQRVAERISDLSLAEWMQDSSIGMRRRVEDNLDSIGMFVGQQIPSLVRALCIPLLLIAAAMLLDIRLALVSLLPLVVAVVLVVYTAKRKALTNVRDQYYTARTQQHERMIEFFSALPAVKMFVTTRHNNADSLSASQEQQRLQLLEQAIDQFETTMQRWIAVVTPPWSLFYAYCTNATLPVLAVGVWLYQQQALSVATLMAFTLLGGAYIRPLFALANSGSQLALVQEAAALFESTLEGADMPQTQSIALIDTHLGYRLEQVNFAYQDKRALTDVNLVLPSNQTIALVGPSGSGKTTLALLLAGVLSPASGKVMLGGVDLASLSREQRTGLIALALQQTHVLDATLGQNVALSQDYDPIVVEELVRKAQLGDVLDSMPQGLDTHLGNQWGGGYTGLSGGERQRLQLARTLYKRAPVVILDESSAFCDAFNEAAMQRAIASLQCVSLIVITHRLISVTQADLIIVLNEGQVVDQGTHNQLVQRSPVYQKLWQAQQG